MVLSGLVAVPLRNQLNIQDRTKMIIKTYHDICIEILILKKIIINNTSL